jgi:AraC-like DNA-binding protein
MPIYMDRHNIPEAITAEDVAQLHQEDLSVQHKFGCRALTYWYDEERKTAFCLVEAPDRKNILKMHNEAHGQVPNSIIEVEGSLVEAFLGRINDPEKQGHTELNIINDPAFRTIMIIHLDQLSINPGQRSLSHFPFKTYRNTLYKLLHKYKGNLVKQSETDFLISFKSVSCSVNAAIKIQSLYSGSNYLHKYKTGIKIALSAGVPVTEKKSIFESTIQLAERMCNTVKSEIILASQVKDLYDSENRGDLAKDKNVFCLTQKDEDFLNRLMDYLDSNADNSDLRVDDFCNTLGVSKSGFYRWLIYLTSKSPVQFINEYRLNKALPILRRNENDVAEVAYRAGFNSPSYFSKCFKKRFGVLPSACTQVSKRHFKRLN